MNMFKSKKNKKIYGLLFLFFGMILANYSLPLLNSLIIDNSNINNEEINNDNPLDFQNQTPETSEYQNFNGAGEDLNITLHQSLVNTSLKSFAYLTGSRSFKEASPPFSGFNSSFTNITIQSIEAFNKSLVIEDDTIDGNDDVSSIYVTSFAVPSSCFLLNASFHVRVAVGSPTGTIYLYKSSWDTGNSRSQPTGSGINIGSFDPPSTDWYNIELTKTYLNNSQTANNTWFIGLHNTVPATTLEWRFVDDSSNGDNSEGYSFSAGWNHQDKDYECSLFLSPRNPNPNPEHIGLKINNTMAKGYATVNGSGYWSSMEQVGSLTGVIQFDVTADWYNISCEITKVQINYTKTDLTTNSDFNCLSSGDNIQWNVTNSGGLNYFDSRINDFNTINFTIPSIWQEATIKVFNGSTEIQASNLNKRLLNNAYREVQVLNAGNGTFWHLTANSTNLLSFIDTYVSGVAMSIANYSNIVEINATFGEIIKNGDLNLSVYSPLPQYLNHSKILSILSADTEFLVSNWNVSVNATQYGIFKIQMSWNNDTAAGFLESFLTIVGDTELNVLAPPTNKIYKTGQSFNITIQYNDTNRNEGVTGAGINYSLNDGASYKSTSVQYIGEGKYNITINIDDSDFTKYGFVDVLINASKDFHVNLTTSYRFHRQITTSIDPGNFEDLGYIMRGLNVSYTFNYSDTEFKPVKQAEWSVIGSSYGFISFLENLGNGNYTMHLDTSFVGVLGSPYDFMFNVSSTGNETQIITLRVNVQIINTEIVNPNWIPMIARNSGLNQTFTFFFNDTTNDSGIQDLITSNVTVKDNSTGMLWNTGDFNWELVNHVNDGNYILNISINGKNSGWYTLKVNVSKFPNYDSSVAYFTFYIRGNYSQINLMSISDPGGVVSPTGFGNNFTIFEESDIDIEFNITDLEYNDNIVLGSVNSYEVTYENLQTGLTGTLSESFQFTSPTHTGTISTSNINLVAGRYLINITVSKTNYENTSFIFNLTVIEKYQTRLTVVYKPTEVKAGEVFSILLLAEFYNGSEWLILQDADIIMTPYFDGFASTEIQTKSPNSTGEVSFDITIRSDASTMNIFLELQVEYDHLGSTLPISDIGVIPLTLGLTFEALLPYIIIIGAVVAFVGSSLAVYRGVVVPKKREKQRILAEVKTIFDDAINLEHILVLYKGTGTCIFFKSYGSEQIDPELIGGFLTAVSSFGKEMATQEALNEISYGDKMLLLADGQYIRVALVLGKKASLILRRHLKEFIDSFEKTYKEVLPNWRGQLNHFRNAGIIVDEVLNTSIILPHQISYDFSSVKELKSSFSKDVLKVAHSCCEEAERDFFFVATLLKEASEKESKDTAETFMGIKELRDKKILIPIEISTIQAQPISQQELNLINQKVASLTTLTNDERQKLVNDLGQLGPIEREAYLSSLTKQHEIFSAPIKTTIGTIIVDNKKSAKKGVKELSKRAKIAKGKNNYQKTIELYQSAAMLASNWELSNEFVIIEEIIRKTKIEDLIAKKKDLEKEAKDAVKNKNYAEASAKYKYASKTASEIFKLGANSMIKEVKRLTKKANEYEKLK